MVVGVDVVLQGQDAALLFRKFRGGLELSACERVHRTQPAFFPVKPGFFLFQSLPG